MLRRVLVANRGEIAVRIISACRKLGMATVAVYSEADRDARHVRLADTSVCIGPPPSKDSYLKIVNVLSAAQVTLSDAIHPGYGFLAENAHFAEVCRESGFAFVGPGHEAIEKMGDKSVARETMIAAGVPVVPGSEGDVRTLEAALRVAEKIGYPVMVKASAGGGGRGMRIARHKDELTKAFDTARTEAAAAFGDGSVYLEKFIGRARHVEVQVLADSYGNVIHLGERDCSVQRRHQKLIEESPSPAVSAALRKRMGAAAVRAAKAVGYVNAGTVEFLLDEKGRFYFMEMNTRIQVEHPVTEMVTGVDLVEQQLRIAGGESIRLKQRDVNMAGHAIECRINAEDPEKGFSPSPGNVTRFSPPMEKNFRVDTHIEEGCAVPPHYDSLIAKAVVHADNRSGAIDSMLRALEKFRIEGIATTIPFHRKLLCQEAFRKGRVHTKFVEEEVLELQQRSR